MSFPIGVFALAPSPSPPPGSRKNSIGGQSLKDEGSTSFDDQFFQKLSPLARHPKALTSKAIAAYRRGRAESSPSTSSQKEECAEERPSSTPVIHSRSTSSLTLEISGQGVKGDNSCRPKHIPIIVPGYESLGSPELLQTDSRPPWISHDSDSSHGSSSRHIAHQSNPQTPVPRDTPKHVEIKIPCWAEPVLKEPDEPPRLNLSRSVLADPFVDFFESSSHSDMAATTTPDPNRANALDGQTQRGTLYVNSSNSHSHAGLSSANSSQSSLVSNDYESASDAESSREDVDASHDQVRASEQNQSSAGQNTQRHSSTPNAANLSGLICNVHRTTGKEPPPLVGATTTILGDKLFVFGGRKLSRTKPQLTSNLYELDLIRRHWTKIEVKGDLPPPRYFHSVNALGDRKLVCYGGMSPAAPQQPQAGETAASPPPPDTQAEVTVMSDIHILDLPSRTWTKIHCSDAPQGRYAHCAAILPSSAVFASSNAPMSALHHNPSSGNQPNQGTLGVALDGTGGAELVVVGGQDSSNHYIEQISVFNLRSLKWTGTTGMGRSCGAYRSVVAPLTTMSERKIGPDEMKRRSTDEEGIERDDEEEEDHATIGSGAPLLVYSNYNFLDVKLELQVRLTNGKLTEKPMQTAVSPPGLRFPNGGVIANNFIVSGTFLTSSKQEYALWTLDLKTLTWSRLDAGGSVFSHGSWNRGLVWNRRNAFIVLGNRRRSLVEDYNNRRVNFSNFALVELEAFGLHDNPRRTEPTSNYSSVSAPLSTGGLDGCAGGRSLLQTAQDFGSNSLNMREMADMAFLAIDGTRIPVNSRLIARRWGSHFTTLLREALMSASDTDAATLRPTTAGHPSRFSSVTITPSVDSTATTVNNTRTSPDLPDARSTPPQSRPRLFYLPHTATTLQALLHYLYTSTLPTPPSPIATTQVLCSLLQLARPYKIDGLLEAVVERLHQALDGRNAAAIFNAAAIGAGGGEGLLATGSSSSAKEMAESAIPLRNASLVGAGMDGASAMTNGTSESGGSLRIDTDVANVSGRATRNTLRPGQALDDDNNSEDEPPDSAATDTSMSDIEASLKKHRNELVWTGATSAVVGLQKRGLRGLMEGRRMRERGHGSSNSGEGRVGLGIA